MLGVLARLRGIADLSSDAFSHKKASFDAVVAFWYAFYDFCRWRETIGCSPAMQVGVTGSIWTMEQLVEKALAAEPCEPPQVEIVTPPEGPARGRRAPECGCARCRTSDQATFSRGRCSGCRRYPHRKRNYRSSRNCRLKLSGRVAFRLKSTTRAPHTVGSLALAIFPR